MRRFGNGCRNYHVPAASGAIMDNGRLTSTFGFGGMDAAVPARIASLSKAITAVCIANLVDAGRLSFTTPLGSVLARTFARLGQPVDPRFRTITIEQLLTAPLGAAARSVARCAGARPDRQLHQYPGDAARQRARRAMTYSNIGYITLGMVVEAVTGSDYERYCRDASLAPMQASGSIDPQLRQRAPSGGWRISAIDYARFIQVFEPGSAGLGPLGAAMAGRANRTARLWARHRHPADRARPAPHP